MKLLKSVTFPLLLIMGLAACQTVQPGESAMVANQPYPVKVIAVETFLADIAQNVAGERLNIDLLIPVGIDPHAYEPTPKDVIKIAEARVLIINGAGMEEWLNRTINNAGSKNILIIEASKGLRVRIPQKDEVVSTHLDEKDKEYHEETGSHETKEHQGIADQQDNDHHHHEGDPHFWLDPNLVITYVENIRNGFIEVDPAGKETYEKNAADYIAELKALDGWIEKQVDQLPPEKRVLVTNHESFGYFADRYGFKIVGTIIPSVSTNAAPSAMQMASLANQVRKAGVPVIFLETGSNPQLANQLSTETGIKVVSGLNSHSITTADGDAPDYIDMMRYNTNLIVNSLK